jgi:hypothetical protein
MDWISFSYENLMEAGRFGAAYKVTDIEIDEVLKKLVKTMLDSL